MWTFQQAGRASELLAALQVIDPLTLPNPLARLVLAQAIALFTALPPNVGIVALIRSDPVLGIAVSLQRLSFGTYAT